MPNCVVRGLPLALILVGFSLIAGCGSSLPSVTGTVTLDGEPLEDARVVFTPADPTEDGAGRPAAGITDAQGHYQLIYGRGKTGAVPGEYQVTIRTYRSGDPDAEEGSDQQPQAEVVPAKYNANSELTATVEPGGSVIDFDLETGDGRIQLPQGAAPVESVN